MSQKQSVEILDGGADGGVAVAPAKTQPKPRVLPPFKVLLHNDDVNDMLHVVRVITELTPLTVEEAVQRMFEAHFMGVALLLVTHRERAELYAEQFATYGLKVTIEADD